MSELDRYEIRVFAFDSSIVWSEQAELVRRYRAIKTAMTGLIECRFYYLQAERRWIEHSSWRAGTEALVSCQTAAEAQSTLDRLLSISDSTELA